MIGDCDSTKPTLPKALRRVKFGTMQLKKLRARQGLSLQNLADLIGSSASTLMRVEHGKIPRGELVLRLQRWAESLGEEIDWPERRGGRRR